MDAYSECMDVVIEGKNAAERAEIINKINSGVLCKIELYYPMGYKEDRTVLIIKRKEKEGA